MDVNGQRFSNNPLVAPGDIKPSRDDLEVACVVNPGAFTYRGRIGLVLRIAERFPPTPGKVNVVVRNESSPGGIEVKSFPHDHPDLRFVDPAPSGVGVHKEAADADPRGVRCEGVTYLTTLSHFRLAWSDDGEHFTVEDQPCLVGHGRYERYGIEDCRVIDIDGTYFMTYTAVSEYGVALGMTTTTDWQSFTPHGLILSAPDKDCAIFPRRVNGKFLAFHRPTFLGMGAGMVHLVHSNDGLLWGGDDVVLEPRQGMWDCAKVGSGAAPLETSKGWLEIYHGVDDNGTYALGAALFDRDDPRILLARSAEPLLTPEAPYEQTGFYGCVVFSCGQIARGDELLVYYGAADTVTCGARFSISEILGSLVPVPVIARER